MKKFSQELGGWNRFKEFVDVPGKIVENLSTNISGPMKTLRKADDKVGKMKTLRKADDKVRKIAVTLKEPLELAKKRFDKKDYIPCYVELEVFYEKYNLIAQELSELKIVIKDNFENYESFMYNQLGEDYKQKLLQKRRFKSQANNLTNSLEKKAGIFSWLTSGLARSKFEKMFEGDLKAMISSTSDLLKDAEKLYVTLIEKFKEMGAARLGRTLSAYKKSMDVIIDLNTRFYEKIKNHYNLYIRRFVERVEAQDEGSARSMINKFIKDNLITEKEGKFLLNIQDRFGDKKTNKAQTEALFNILKNNLEKIFQKEGYYQGYNFYTSLPIEQFSEDQKKVIADMAEKYLKIFEAEQEVKENNLAPIATQNVQTPTQLVEEAPLGNTQVKPLMEPIAVEDVDADGEIESHIHPRETTQTIRRPEVPESVVPTAPAKIPNVKIEPHKPFVVDEDPFGKDLEEEKEENKTPGIETAL